MVDYAVIFIVTLLVYAWSAPRTVVLEDDGIFILAAYFNGVAHPPGYPLYTLLAHLASLVPVGTVAYRVHLFSGIMASLACICLWQIAHTLLGNRIYAHGAALSLGLSRVFWSQAIIAEVYTLNVFLVLLLLLLAIYMQKPQAEHDLKIKISLFSLCYGLALANHWPLVILSTPMLIAVLWPQRRSLPRYMLYVVPWFLAGLSPYAWMVLASHINPEISFYGPITNFHEFWFYVGRKGYAYVDSSLSAGWLDKLNFVKFVLQQTGEQYGWPVLIPALAGLVYQLRLLPANLSVAFILGYIGSTLLLVFLLGFDYDELHKSLFRVYPLIAYAVVSLWIATGLRMLTEITHKVAVNRVGINFLASCFLAATVGIVMIHNISANYRGNDYWARQYAVTILDSLPENALLFLYADADIGPVAYLNKVEGYRKDVVLYHKRGLILGNRLFQPLYADGRTTRKAIENFIQSENRPIYYIDDLLHNHGVDLYGLYHGVVKDKNKSYIRAVFLPGFLAYWELLLNLKTGVDPRINMHRIAVLYDGCRLFTTMEKFAGTGLWTDVRLKKIYGKICNNLLGSYARIEMVLNDAYPERAMLDALLQEAELHLDEARTKSETALFYYFTGRMHLLEENIPKARSFLQQSVKVWDHPDNPASELLHDLPE